MELNDKLRVRIFCTQQAQTSVNVTYWRVTAKGGAGVSPAAWLVTLQELIAPKLKALMSNKARYWGCSIQKVTPPVDGVQLLQPLFQGAGTAGVEPLPKQICGIFTKTTLKAGRAFRGRFYCPFPAQLDNEETTNQPSAGYMTRLGELAANITSPLTSTVDEDSNQLWPAILHTSSKNFPSRIGTTDDVFGARATGKWATQRRRGDFGRENAPPAG